MQIIYRFGDLMAAREPFLLHGCNARGVMGSGVAKLIRDRHPKAYEEYRRAFETSGLRLGEVIPADCGTVTVLNGITQENFGRDPNVVYVDYDAVRAVIRRVEAIAGAVGVAMPLIGSGLANGSWKRISTIIEDEAKTFQPIVYHDRPVPTT